MTQAKKSEGLLVLNLARGKSVKDAAKAAGLSRMTIYRRLADEEFMVKVRGARRRIFQQTVGLLVDTSIESVAVLRELHKSTGADGDQVRARVALGCLRLARDWIRVEDLEARVATLEADKLRKDRSNGHHY